MISFIRVLVVLCVLIEAGCSPEQRLERARTELMEQYASIPNYDFLPERRLSWNDALAMLEKNNLEYNQALKEWRDAKSKENKVYRDLIPLVNLGYYYNTALLNQGGMGYGDEKNYNMNIIFNIPALTQIPIDHYTSSLIAFKALKNCELKKRELVAKLYQIFREYDLDARENALAGDVYVYDEILRKEQQRQHELEMRKKWGQLCMLINDYSARWHPVGATVPAVSWNQYRKLVTVPGDLTQIMMAMELEASRLKKIGVQLRYWPTVQVDFYSPRLFSMSGGNDTGFMGGGNDVRLNMNFYLQLDTRLDVWRDLKEAKDSHELLVRLLRQKMFEFKEKTALLVKSWDMYREWKSAMEEYDAFRRKHGALDPESVKSLYDASLELKKETIARERENLERECALIQEYGIGQGR